MSKHTPGPWTAVGPHLSVIRQADTFIPLAQVYTPTAPKGEDPYDCKTANARLIKASPDLLEACKAALPILESVVELPNVSRLLRDAMAKAEPSNGECQEGA